MFRRNKSFCGPLQRHCRVLALPAVVALALLPIGSNAWAASGAAAENQGPLRLLFTVPVPAAATNATGGMYGFDISFVDQKTQTYYLGDRSNAAVDAVDASTGTFIKQIVASPAFAGVKLNTMTGAVNNNISGPNGVATDGAGKCLFAGDGPSRVVSFALPSGKQVSDVSTGGMFRADEMAYDPKDKLLIVANNADAPPFATLIPVSAGCKLTVPGKKISLTAATNGAEQPVWDPGTQRFYMSIPSISGTTTAPGIVGAIARINPLTAKIETMFAVPFCMPAGLALGPNETFLAGCSVVYDTMGNPWSGSDANSASPLQVIIDTLGVYAVVPGIGSSDEVWYNAGDNHWYTGSQNTPYSPHPVAGTGGGLSTTDQGAGLLGAIDGTSQNLDQIVPTFDVPLVAPALGPPPGHPSGSSHSVAANATNNWVFVPLPANNAILGCLTGCVGVYGRKDIDLVGAND
jgi:hypothetical protein